MSTRTLIAPSSGRVGSSSVFGRPRLLDLYCKAGGAAMGYHRAGFEVVGVDIEAQPRYPFEFVRADALDVLADRAFVARFAAVHASPPCHDHSTLVARAGADGSGWLLDATRRELVGLGVPWVIENVPGAPMCPHVVLCGEMFGLRTIRHRWFELGGWWVMSPGHPPHTRRSCTRKRRSSWDAGLHISVTGDVGSYVGGLALGIDWMTGAELSQAVPPAYTRWLGEQLLTHLNLTPAGRAVPAPRRSLEGGAL